MLKEKTSDVRKKISKLNKEPVKELLTEEYADILSVTTKFSLQELVMKNDLRWKATMRIHEILPEGRHDYSVKLEFDDTPYLENITQIERDIAAIQSTPSLLPDVDAKDLKDMDNRISKINTEMKALQKECKTIDFIAKTEQIKWANNDTLLYFRIADSVIEPLNNFKYKLNHYRAVLTPIYKNSVIK